MTGKVKNYDADDQLNKNSVNTCEKALGKSLE